MNRNYYTDKINNLIIAQEAVLTFREPSIIIIYDVYISGLLI